MTYLEAIKADLFAYPIPEYVIIRNCQKQGICYSSMNYGDDEDKIDLIVLNVLVQMVKLSSISEGGVSKSFDLKGAEKQIKVLCNKLGLDSSMYVEEPTVKYLGDL